ncbi:MAG: sensor histidine kinase [Cyanobacteria bacterium SZAS LIN-2]|nr:sensor histidine kinase [Cyanobacteria bacterium SZAS LIN-2]
MDTNAILKRIRQAEWLTQAITAVCQLAWMWGNGLDDIYYKTSIACMALAAGLIAVGPTRGDNKKLIALYLAQGTLYMIATATGTFRLYGLVFFLLVVKAALLNNLKTTIALSTFFFLGHAGAHLISVYFYKSHLHSIIHDGPIFLTINFVESQIIAGVVFVAVILFTRAILAEQASRARADRLTKEIEDMAVAVERGRIVRDIHDGVGHSLTSLNIQLELTSKQLEGERKEEARQSLELSRKIASGALTELRRSLKTIKEEDINLADAVDSLAQRIKEQRQIAFEIDIDETALSTSARHNLLLIVKECLTNIQKHASASIVKISLASGAGKAELLVTDNGRGFQSADDAEGLGIRGMHERVASLGGTLKIKSLPGQGTEVLVSLPT